LIFMRIRFLCAALASATAVILVSPTSASATPRALPAPIDHSVAAAVGYARSHGVDAAVAVLDERTGRLYHSGPYRTRFGSASVMKLFIATKLLATGQMHGATARTAYNMITRSDDAAARALLPRVGGTSVVTWVAHRYHIPFLGGPTHIAWCFGNTQITAKGIVYFYRRMQRDGRVAPWLMHALRQHARHGSDGTDQSFGIPSTARRGAAVKQGWGGRCSANDNGSVINTTGVVGRGRYAVAILTQTRRSRANGRAYNAYEAAVVNRMAHMILPGGTVNLPQSHNPLGAITAVATAPNRATVTGWAFDPDQPSRALRVRVLDGSTVRSSRMTAVSRPDVNRHYRLRGVHGVSVSIALTPGRHRICLVSANVKYGDAPLARCRMVTVPAAPTP
jgi:hypothetical protein